MNPASVDIVIPIHSGTRPLHRAVSSILDRTTAPVSVIVVVHNIDAEVIRGLLGEFRDDERVRLIELHDGIPSPAGPLNAGLDAATAPYVCVMGSDDELEAGAIDSWLALARATGAAMAIPHVYRVGRGYDAFPPIRVGRTRDLDPVKDRLSYRSAPLGLIERARLGDLRFTEHLKSGEDLPFTVRAWFSGHPLAFDRHGPAYLEHPDATDRVTSGGRTVDEDFAFLAHIIDTPWFAALPLRERKAIVIKIIRTQIFDAIGNRLPDDRWTAEEWDALKVVLRRLSVAAPGAEKNLSRVDRDILDRLTDEEPDREEFLRLIGERWHYRSFRALTPRNLLRALDRQGPFRTLYAGLRLMTSRPAP